MKSKRILSLIMAVILLMALAVPAFASGSDDSETTIIDLGESGQMVLSNENDGISPRFPGTAGLYSVVAYPAKVGSKDRVSDYSTGNYSGNGRTSILNVTLDDATRQAYDRNGADGYLAEVTLNLSGVTRFEVFMNGEAAGGGNCAGYTKGTLELWLYNDSPATWRIDLYDNNTTNGKSTWGYIFYQ